MSASAASQADLVIGRRLAWTNGSVDSSSVFELDPETQLVDELVRTGRVDIWWGGSNIKYVQLRDRLTGLRASGRSYVSWNIALEQAADRMRRLMTEEADQ